MKAIRPVTLTTAALLAHTIDEPSTADGLVVDYEEWDLTYSYAEGDRCMLASTHRVYESLVGSNTNNPPLTSPSYWVDIGPTNRWAMFDQAVGTSTVADDTLSVTIELNDADYVNAIALLDMSGVVAVKIELISVALGSASISGSPSVSPSSSLSASPSGSISGSPSSSPSSSVSSSPSLPPGSGSVSSSPSSSPSSSASSSPSTSLSGSPSSSPSGSAEPLAFGTDALSISSGPMEFGDSVPLELTRSVPAPRSMAAPQKLPGPLTIPIWNFEGFPIEKDLAVYETYDTTFLGWYDYFFSPITYADSFVHLGWAYQPGALLKITFTGGTGMSVGTLVFGKTVNLGSTQWGLGMGITDYSTKETDEYGATTIIERVYAKKMDCDLFFEHLYLREIYKFLASVRATPIVWVGSEESTWDTTIVYGFYKDFNIILQDYGGCFCSLEIEGLI
jgi:hypothetical protein